MPSYDFATIEPRWQNHWVGEKTFRTPDPDDPSVKGKPKHYILDMFPYPSGAGLHVGHPEGYTATDILARFRRMNGFHVLHPMGWDAFGLPAEQHAINTGEHPAVNTQRNIDNFRRQIQALGFSYDWDREVNTTAADYVKWTQWLFLLIHDTWYDNATQKGRPISELPIPDVVKAKGDAEVRKFQDSFRLAYEDHRPVNWCPELGTVLANEEVVDGKSERGGHPVVRQPIRQWSMRITAYAERLLNDLDPLDWSESIKQMQRNWIGKSEGAELTFKIAGHDAAIDVYTTRPDTLYGATYMVLSPEHILVPTITTDVQRQSVTSYQETASRKSDFERAEMSKTKTGVFTGAFAINPANNANVPIWIADYVLAGYGTGAIMAVPGHDERDFEFAKQFDLPIVNVVSPADGTTINPNEAFTDHGIAVNSRPLDGWPTVEAKAKMIAIAEENGFGTGKINYKLRDWLFSRQRYWGEPFPILHDADGVTRLSVEELPVELPQLTDYKPTGSPDGPLAKATDWLSVERDGKIYRRETNTMPQWAGSCWYYLRYIDPTNSNAFADPKKLDYWLPVDLYVGGAEHAVLHLLYARFWHKILYDRSYVSCPEPFQKLVNQGMILGEDNEKMSKARGNVVNPDDIIKDYGADSLRLYEMFMGPLEAVKPWQTKSVSGVSRFLGKVWRLIVDENTETMQLHPKLNDDEPDKETLRKLHQTIRKVTFDTEGLRFNTAIASMMELVNHLTKHNLHQRNVLDPLVLLLGPYAPHIAEELWHALGHEQTLAYEPWPKFDEELAKDETIEVPVQINGKVKTKLHVPAEVDKADLETAAMSNDIVLSLLEGKTIKKIIVVPGKLVNIVVG